ncbi:hypothetical protein HDA32_004495 [Spinactinospora alkalitolerans]|uniref:J domain-containing protein n=1 Tax=Spinactinospora alkalitolerans TaxID=687207 RepID=A0A852U1G5_9ACTN|nr:hypothetical protein [Spinactinospora alkalitolerans]NYE49375.1 hypothetical protein [Spinactinospora alkalitolerans]
MSEERRAFREWALENHPDRGGDPEVFAEGLARWRRCPRPPGGGAGEIGVHRAPRGPVGWIAEAVRRRSRRRARARRLR